MKMRAYINTLHIATLAVAMVLSAAAVVVGIVFAATSGGEIPVKYDDAGQPLEYASAWENIVLPVVFLVVNAMMALFVLVAPTSIWNIPATVTEKNAPILYRDAASMVCVITLIFGLMSFIGTILLYTARKAASGIMTAGTVTMVLVSVVFLVKIVIDGRKYA